MSFIFGSIVPQSHTCHVSSQLNSTVTSGQYELEQLLVTRQFGAPGSPTTASLLSDLFHSPEVSVTHKVPARTPAAPGAGRTPTCPPRPATGARRHVDAPISPPLPSLFAVAPRILPLVDTSQSVWQPHVRISRVPKSSTPEATARRESDATTKQVRSIVSIPQGSTLNISTHPARRQGTREKPRTSLSLPRNEDRTSGNSRGSSSTTSREPHRSSSQGRVRDRSDERQHGSRDSAAHHNTKQVPRPDKSSQGRQGDRSGEYNQPRVDGHREQVDRGQHRSVQLPQRTFTNTEHQALRVPQGHTSSTRTSERASAQPVGHHGQHEDETVVISDEDFEPPRQNKKRKR